MVEARGRTGREAVLDSLPVDELGAHFGGQLLRPGDGGYDAARRIWNGAIDKRPALIARSTGVADVIASVRFARDHDLVVAVRGGGHNVAGTAVCDDGLVIDLSAMKGTRVDPVGRTADVQPGLLWGELNRETQAFGLATPGGIISHTGVAGLTLGGGIGWLMRKHGLTCDNLLSVDVVTADGQLVTAGEAEHADLFWGIRGGGGNFGIVTSFAFRLHPIGPMVLAGLVLYHGEKAHDVLRFYRDYAGAAPDGLTTIVFLRHVPSVPLYPRHLHGAPVVAIGVCYAGPIEAGERVVEPLRLFGPPLMDLVRPTAFTAHHAILDPSVPHGLQYYWKSEYLPGLSDQAIDTLVAHAWRALSPKSYTIIFQLGGAVSRVGEDETAFSGRGAGYAVNINSACDSPQEADADIQWVRDMWEALWPSSTGGVYVNFLGNEGDERVRAAYGGEKYHRLVALKNKYDPDNFFRLNQNIKPSV